MPTGNTTRPGTIYIHSKRSYVDSKYVSLYRCFNSNQNVLLTAHADRFGKPIIVFGPDGNQKIGEIRNRKGYLVNGRTDFHDLQSQKLLGSYSRLSRVFDDEDHKIGKWRDARSWSDQFKVDLVDAIGNALLGAGDVPGGANPSDTHLLSHGKEILATLQQERLPFFPEPPKRTKPGRLAKLASKIVPGELGKSLGEIRPPSGWSFTRERDATARLDEELLIYSAIFRIEFLRWSRSA